MFMLILSICMGLPLWLSGKESACNAGDPGSIPGPGRSPGGGMATPSGILTWRIPWTEEPGGLWSMRLQRVRHSWSDWAGTHIHLSVWRQHCRWYPTAHLFPTLYFVMSVKNHNLEFNPPMKPVVKHLPAHHCSKPTKSLLTFNDQILTFDVFNIILLSSSFQICAISS